MIGESYLQDKIQSIESKDDSNLHFKLLIAVHEIALPNIRSS